MLLLRERRGNVHHYRIFSDLSISAFSRGLCLLSAEAQIENSLHKPQPDENILFMFKCWSNMNPWERRLIRYDTRQVANMECVLAQCKLTSANKTSIPDPKFNKH